MHFLLAAYLWDLLLCHHDQGHMVELEEKMIQV